MAMTVKGQSSLKEDSNFDLTLSTSKGSFSTALGWYRFHGLGEKKKLELGYGVRVTSFIGANKYYTTAPAKYTSPVQNLGTLFSETLEHNIDTITTATSITNSLNLAIYIQYKVTTRLSVGFNIDAIGFSFGPSRKFNIISSSFDAGQAPVQKGSPTAFNLLLTSDNDIGSLNSEFYAGFGITKKLSVKAGLTFLFSEYRTGNQLSFDNGRIMNDRYRYKSAMALVGICLQPFKN